jgi:hypothetical protein
MNKKFSLCAFASILMLSGCTWVKTTPEGEKVRVLDATEVATCKELGAATVSLVDKVAGIERDPQKVQKELELLARNSAARMGGDTVVPASDISDGQQRFTVYKCVGVDQ